MSTSFTKYFIIIFNKQLISYYSTNYCLFFDFFYLQHENSQVQARDRQKRSQDFYLT